MQAPCAHGIEVKVAQQHIEQGRDNIIALESWCCGTEQNSTSHSPNEPEYTEDKEKWLELDIGSDERVRDERELGVFPALR